MLIGYRLPSSAYDWLGAAGGGSNESYRPCTWPRGPPHLSQLPDLAGDTRALLSSLIYPSKLPPHIAKMADQEMEGQDFTEDCSGGDFQGNGMENGEGVVTESGDGKKDSGAADAPGRDDDRYL